mmetsp:Transcript_13826/g.19786  ORF Transcript_13826/g.19786 Transcript_13826/m.19786 type:complete len:83 (-) Transcript_13826:1009-1257(-)
MILCLSNFIAWSLKICLLLLDIMQFVQNRFFSDDCYQIFYHVFTSGIILVTKPPTVSSKVSSDCNKTLTTSPTMIVLGGLIS